MTHPTLQSQFSLLQIRAENEFDLEGNWSDAIQIRRIRLLPSPGNITVVISENIRVVSLENGLSRVSGEVVLKWEAPDSPTELEDAVTTYQSWVGREALDQFETPPSPPNTFEVNTQHSVVKPASTLISHSYTVICSYCVCAIIQLDERISIMLLGELLPAWYQL